MALSALGTTPRYRLNWLDELGSEVLILSWLKNLDWNQRVAFTSNAVQNWVASMQYARDFLDEKEILFTCRHCF